MVVFVQCGKDGLLFGFFKVFQKVNDIVVVYFVYGFGQYFGGQLFDDFFVDGFVDFGQDVVVDFVGIKFKELFVLLWCYLFDQVGDVGGMDWGQQCVQMWVVVFFDGVVDYFVIMVVQL